MQKGRNMTQQVKVSIRASQVPEWADCQARAGFHLQRPGPLPGRPNVGQVVGNYVHQNITGQAFEPPRFVEWDEATRNEREMSRQVQNLTKLATQELERASRRVILREVEMKREMDEPPVLLEVTGHIDGVLELPNGDLSSLELKTGKNPPRTSWLQSGVYAWIWMHHTVSPDGAVPVPFFSCTVLWLDRKNERAVFQERLAADIVPLARATLAGIARAMSAGYSYNPSSLSCSTCLHTECAVRYEKPPASQNPLAHRVAF